MCLLVKLKEFSLIIVDLHLHKETPSEKMLREICKYKILSSFLSPPIF
jgi:hypothetical protein